MTDLAKTIVAAVLGFIAAVVSYPYLDNYLVGLVAFIAAAALGFLVFVGVRGALAGVGTHTRRW